MTQVLPYESMLRGWLRSHFSQEKDVDDIVQESFAKLLQVRDRGEIRSPKAFLFATARNLVISCLRKVSIRSEISLADFDTADVMDEADDVTTAVSKSEELDLLSQAIQSLPTRCRQVITLRKIYGLSQKEVARELGISENTVESQGAIGLRKLAEFFAHYDSR